MRPTRPTTSWIDHLLDGIRALPIPEGLVYAAAGLLELFVIHFTKWSDGSLPRFQFSAPNVLLAFWTVFPLAFIDYLDRVADRQVRAIAPALTVDEAGVEQILHELTTMPARPTVTASAIGIGILWLARLTNPELFAPALTSPLGGAVWMGLASLNFALVAGLIYHTVRQLTRVSRIHAHQVRINLFRLDPLYSFSALAAQTGTGLILALYLSLAGFPALLGSLLAAVIVSVMVALAAAAFFLPLYGIPLRILAAKRAFAAETSQRAQAAIQRLYTVIDSGDVEGASRAIGPVNTLLSMRTEASRIPTWPWSPGTLTAFLSAVLLPLAIWAVQQVLASRLP